MASSFSMTNDTASNLSAWRQDVRRTAKAVRRRMLAHTLDNNGSYLSRNRRVANAAENLRSAGDRPGVFVLA